MKLDTVFYYDPSTTRGYVATDSKNKCVSVRKTYWCPLYV